MSKDVLGTTGARKRTRIIWIALVVVLLGALGIAAAFVLRPWGDSASAPAAPSTATPTPTVTATPAPPAPPTDSGELDDAAAGDVLGAALTAAISSAGTPEDLDELLREVAVDDYAAELGAQWLELSTYGWSIEGKPVIESVEVTGIDTDAPSATAQVVACIDSSDVRMLDNTGARIGDDTATTPRSLHLFSLAQGEDGSWRVSAHSFPNDPTC